MPQFRRLIIKRSAGAPAVFINSRRHISSMLLFQTVHAPVRTQAKQQQQPEYTRQQLQFAVREAGKGVGEWLGAKNKVFSTYGRPISVVWGPSPDCYRYRVQDTEFPAAGDGVGDTTPEKLAMHMKKAAQYHVPISERDVAFARRHKVPINAKAVASGPENLVLFMLHAQARMGGEDGRIYAAKHLFEQGAEFENTELAQISYPSGLSELLRGAARPFIDLVLSKNQPKALMAGHASYPSAEAELREKYLSLPSILPPGRATPVSVSPHFLQGFVRNDMHFSGIIATDDAGMGAMRDYFESVRPSLPKEMQKLSHEALFFVLSVYAGVNFPLHSFEAPERQEVRRIYESSQEFRTLFNSLALESLFLKLHALDPSGMLVSGLKLSDMSALQGSLSEEKQLKIWRLGQAFKEGKDEFEAKFFSIASFDSKMPESKAGHAGLPEPVLLVLLRFSETTDLWNRTGVINVEFRKRVIESLTGKSFPEPDGFPTEAAWLSALFSSKDFASAYAKIDWSSAGMQAIFEEYYSELASGSELSKMEKMGRLVPRKIE